MKDYYGILEVSPTASQEEIREQYLFLIQAWHPDKFSKPAQKAKAEEKCKQINIAYEALKEAHKRAQYDRERKGQPAQGRTEEARRDAQEPRSQAEPAPRRQAGTQQPMTSAEEQRVRAELNEQQWEEQEWIRVFFEQARRRQSGQPGTGAIRDSQQPIRVLIVDDLADTRIQIRHLLSSETDLRVVGEAADGRAAIAQFDALMPDVMITGINMPNLDGLAATHAVRRKHPMAKVIILSVHSSAGYIRQAAMAGACDYLTKPPAAGELKAAIRLAAGRAASTSQKQTTK